MDNPPQRPPRFWPLLFMGAFFFGALLWGVWMVHIVRKTRADRDRITLDPMSGVNPPAKSYAPSPSNSPVAPAQPAIPK